MTSSTDSQSDRVRRWAPLCCAAIVLIGVAIRLAALPHSLWVDEVASVKFAQEPWSHLWSGWMRRETNPPLFYSVLKAWTHFAGTSDIALRIPSILYGSASIALAYLLGDKLAGRWAGLAAACLVAVAPAEVQYSLEIRGYAQAQFAALAALLGLVRFCDADRDGGRWAGLALYAVGCAGALYSHTMLLLLPLFANLWLMPWLVLVRRAKPAILLEWIAVNAVVLAAYLWWLSITLWQIEHPANLIWIVRPQIGTAASYVLKIYGPRGPAWQVTLAAIAMLPAFFGMIWLHRRRASLVLPVCAVGAPILLFLLSYKTPVMIPRAFFWAAAPFLIAVAIGVTSIRDRRLGGALFGLILLLNLSGAVAYARRPDLEPYNQIVAEIQKSSPHAIVVAGAAATAMSLDRYCAQQRCSLTIASIEGPESWAVDMKRPGTIGLSNLPRLLACHGEIYTLVRRGQNDPSRTLARVADPLDMSAGFATGTMLDVVKWRARSGVSRAGAADCGAAEFTRHD